MTELSDSPELLVGRCVDDADVVAYLATHNPKKKVKKSIDDELVWSSKKAGLEIQGLRASRRITTVFLHAKGYEDFKQYRGVLPHGLKFGMTKDETKSQMQLPPSFDGPTHTSWDFDDYRLIVQYWPDNSIMVVAVTGDF